LSGQISEQVKVLSLHQKRKRISQKQRLLIAEYLDEKYGHKCCYCEVTANLSFHHKDGDRNNTILANMAWGCSECQNTHPVASKTISLSPNTNLLQTPLDKNQISEPAFVAFSRDWTRKVPPIPIKVFVRESAFECKCHPKTIEGYLFKYSASKGHLRVTENSKKERFVEAA
jgi:hypothetical protein